MKQLNRYILCFWILIFSGQTFAQNTLPDFSVKELSKNKVQVSWENPFPNCIQLAVQRSTDSLSNFRTIYSAQSPELPVNGFIDNNPAYLEKFYYRIFYVLKGGDFYFSKVKLLQRAAPVPEPVKPLPKESPAPAVKTEKIKEPKKTAEPPKDMVNVMYKKAVLFHFSREEYLHFRDSINTKTKDALHKVNDHTIEWKPSKKITKKDITIVYGPEGIQWELNKKNYARFKDSIFRKTKDSLTRLDESHVQFRPFVAKAKEITGIYLNDILIREIETGLFKHFRDSVSLRTKDTLFIVNTTRADIHPFTPKPKDSIHVYRNDSLLVKLDPAQYRHFRDSVAVRTKDTVFVTDNLRVDIHSFIPKYVWRPSDYVFTNAKGYVTILLPQVKQHKYHIIFFDTDGSELFRIRSLKETELILDKTNFLHAGWFSFELFEDEKLKEKSKFQLQKDGN